MDLDLIFPIGKAVRSTRDKKDEGWEVMRVRIDMRSSGERPYITWLHQGENDHILGTYRLYWGTLVMEVNFWVICHILGIYWLNPGYPDNWCWFWETDHTLGVILEYPGNLYWFGGKWPYIRLFLGHPGTWCWFWENDHIQFKFCQGYPGN